MRKIKKKLSNAVDRVVNTFFKKSQLRIVLHVGLPKTATSYLQTMFFPKLPDVNLIQKKTSPANQKYWNSVLRGKKKERSAEIFGMLRDDMINIVSDENISMTPLSIWNGDAVGPETVSRRIEKMSRRTTGRRGVFSVILTIRRQDRWLASRYAESAKLLPDACQADFEQRVLEILARDDDGASAWLNYCDTVAAISKSIAPENILVLMLEELEADPPSWSRKLEKFLGVKAPLEINGGRETRRVNALYKGDDRWKLKGGDKEIFLSDDLSRKILLKYSNFNKMLAEKFSIDGSRFGYF